jgi:hypothetical protein
MGFIEEKIQNGGRVAKLMKIYMDFAKILRVYGVGSL